MVKITGLIIKILSSLASLGVVVIHLITPFFIKIAVWGWTGRFCLPSSGLRIIDGDSLEINGVKIRLHGIDAPELKQPGGRHAAQNLARLCAFGPLHVSPITTDKYSRQVSRLTNREGRDIGLDMVLQGYARADPDYTTAYVKAEKIAQFNQSGLWKKGYLDIHPKDWRAMRGR